MKIMLYEVIEAISNKVRHAREGLVAEIILCSIDTGRVTLTTDPGNYTFT